MKKETFQRYYKGWWSVLASIIICIPLAMGGLLLNQSDSYKQFFDEDNVLLNAMVEMESDFEANDNILIGIEAEDTLFKKRAADAIAEITKEAWELPYTRRVDSIANHQFIESRGDELIVESAFNNFYSQVEKKVMGEKNLVGRLVSDRKALTGVRVLPAMPDDKQALFVLGDAIDELIAKYQEKYPELSFMVSGTVPMNLAFSKTVDKDVSLLYPFVFILIGFAAVFVFKSWFAALATLLVAFLSIGVSMGVAGYAGIPITTIVAMVPIMVLVLAVADVVHLLNKYQDYMARYKDKTLAIVYAIKGSSIKIIWTSCATALGFLSLCFSDSPPYRHFGSLSALGVMAACVLSLFLVPAMLQVFNVKGEKEVVGKRNLYMGISEFAIKYKYMACALLGLIVIVSSYGAINNKPVDALLEYFDEEMTFRKDTEYLSKWLTGIYDVQFRLNTADYVADGIEAGDVDSIVDPDFIGTVSRFQDWLNKQPEVRHVESIVEVLKQLNQHVTGMGDEAFYKLPGDRELGAQILNMYEMSLPFGQTVSNLITEDKESTRVIVTVENLRSDEMKAFVERAQSWLTNNGLQSYGVSPPVLFSRISEENIRNIIQSFFGFLFLISFCLYWLLKDWRLSIISLVPNLAPMSMAFGFWYLYDGEISQAVAIVIGIAFGIAVDATVHIISTYKDYLNEGHDEDRAISLAIADIGPAITKLTVIMMAGFSVLLLSSFHPNIVMAQLTILTLAFGLIADFILLPALLAVFKKNFSKAMLVGVAGLFASSSASADLVMSAQPLISKPGIHASFNKMAEDISEIIGDKVHYDQPQDWLEYVSKLKRGDYDIVVDQVSMAGWRMHNQNLFHRAVAVAPPVQYIVVSREEQGVQGMSDLEFKTICVPLGGVHYARLRVLEEFGNPVRQPSFLPSETDLESLNKLGEGNCSAAVVQSNSLTAENMPVFKVIQQYAPVPAVAVTISQKLPREIVWRLRDYLQSSSPIVLDLVEGYTGQSGVFDVAENEDLKVYGSLLMAVGQWGW